MVGSVSSVCISIISALKMTTELLAKQKQVAVIGLGYVGLPLALALARHFRVIGYDTDADRIDQMQQGIDPSQQLMPGEFADADIQFAADTDALRQAHFFIIAVPTPVNKYKVPDLSHLRRASETVGHVLKYGDYVVYESTVYPGCTEDDCLPVLERTSGLSLGRDFSLGYSPERISPGDKTRSLTGIQKVVSGHDAEAARVIADVYGRIITAGVYVAPSIRVAEAAKVVENVQRDLNISLMNELAIIFDKMNLDTYEVLKAAGTKWNFLPFTPGLVGGHCIGIDPYYLLYKARQLGYDPQVINSGRRINDGMPAFIATKTVQMLLHNNKDLRQCRVLVMGLTFKENMADIRNSRVADLITELTSYAITVDVTDPHARPADALADYNLTLLPEPTGPYEAVVVAVAHDDYRGLDTTYFQSLMPDGPILLDVKGVYSPSVLAEFDYWRL